MCINAYTQPTLTFKQFTQKDGLASSHVLSICQDHLGFIWIGTENGLNRFDGKNFLWFKHDPEDPETLNDNWIIFLKEDSKQNLWIGTERGLNRLNRQTGKIERISLNKLGKSIEVGISRVDEDPQGHLWVSSYNEGVFKLNQSQKGGKNWSATHVPEASQEQDDMRTNRRIKLIEAEEGALWLMNNQGINRFDMASKEISLFPYPSEAGPYVGLQDELVSVVDQNGKIFIGLADKIYMMDKRGKNPELVKLPFSDKSMQTQKFYLKNLILDRPNVLLIPSPQNLILLDTRTMEQQVIKGENQTTDNLFPDYIHAIYKDRQGNYWIGTEGSGLYIGQVSRNPFRMIQHEASDPNSLSKGQVRTIDEDTHANLWVGILNQGLEQFPSRFLGRKLREITSMKPEYKDVAGTDRIIKLIVGADGDLWIATLTHGLIRMDSTATRFQSFSHQSDVTTSMSGNRLWALIQDPSGYIWAGTWEDGLNRIDPNTGQIKRFQHKPTDPYSLGDDRIRCLYADRQGIIWIGTEGGLGRYDPETGQFAHYKHDDDDPRSLSDNLVWSIYEDKEGILWVGTNTGLNRFDTEDFSFQRYYERDGLPDNTIYGILEDDDDVLWMSTENGLALKLSDEADYTFRSFGLVNDLETTSFLPKAYLNSAYSPHLYFGSTDGILMVNPQLLQNDSIQPNFALHAVSRFNTSPTHPGTMTNYFLSGNNERFSWGYYDQNITFTIADLNWLEQNRYQYEYYIDGLSQKWTPLDEDMQISFNKPSPGNYSLSLRAKNLENVHSEVSEMLRFRINPPWWQSTWAYLLYIALIAMAVFFLYHFQLRRKLLAQEAEQLKKLDEVKSRFFTNISHEFRTPLTVISGMSNQIEANPDQWLGRGIKLIKRNSTQLLSLVNQILDLRKLESNSLKLHLTQGDMVKHLQYIIDAFKAIAESNNIRIHFLPTISKLEMDYDSDKIMQIFSNLLSNAIKYMDEEGGDIYVQMDQKEIAKNNILSVQIRDTGRGISHDDLPYIFDRFYQVESFSSKKIFGSGIGLALTKELVNLMDGDIEVESEEGEGTTFILNFPIIKRDQTQKASTDYLSPFFEHSSRQEDESLAGIDHTQADQSNTLTSSNLPTLLIVEDNLDIQVYLRSCLEKNYDLLIANDGQEGIDLAIEKVPDLIISDVMMPKKNGFELCDTLKNHEITSHIPLILLTAKSSLESKISGLRKGADAYLTKPFEPEELSVRLEQLFQLRKKLQARYSQMTSEEKLPVSEAHQMEDQFILKLKEIVLEHLTEDDFNTQRLCKAIGLGRTQLHNKIKALTGQSTSIFVRSIRLQKAQELLKTTDLNVSEVSYEVGISNPKYFSRIYTEMFGKSPSEHMNN